VFLSLVEQDLSQAAPDDSVLSVELTCLNRDLPARLPFGGGQPRLQLAGGSAPITQLRCLTRPSPTLRPPLGAGARWRLISHLALNHLSLVQGEVGAAALKEMLRLYDFKDSPESRDAVEGLMKLSSRSVNGRVPGGGPGVVCRGTEVTIQLDPDRYTGGGLYLFASVLERFLGLYCAINSFTRLIATVKGWEGTLRTWPARAGDHTLL
jgi:type VI secretion system protein ImpG